MIIKKESVLSQEFKVLPRYYIADKIQIDGIEGSETYNITATQDGIYLSFDTVVTLKEGQFYTLTVLDDTREVYRGRIFCTNQTVSEYTINKDTYKEVKTNNDFVTI